MADKHKVAIDIEENVQPREATWGFPYPSHLSGKCLKVFIIKDRCEMEAECSPSGSENRVRPYWMRLRRRPFVLRRCDGIEL